MMFGDPSAKTHREPRHDLPKKIEMDEKKAGKMQNNKAEKNQLLNENDDVVKPRFKPKSFRPL